MRTSNSAYAKFCTCYAINDNKSFAANAQLKTKQIEHIYHKTDHLLFNSEISDFHYLKTLLKTADKFVFRK